MSCQSYNNSSKFSARGETLDMLDTRQEVYIACIVQLFSAYLFTWMLFSVQVSTHSNIPSSALLRLVRILVVNFISFNQEQISFRHKTFSHLSEGHKITRNFISNPKAISVMLNKDSQLIGKKYIRQTNSARKREKKVKRSRCYIRN